MSEISETPEDLASLESGIQSMAFLMARSFHPNFAQMNEEEATRVYSHSLNFFKRALSREETLIFTARDLGNIKGVTVATQLTGETVPNYIINGARLKSSLNISPEDHIIFIETTFVDPKYRGQGIARSLREQLEESVKKVYKKSDQQVLLITSHSDSNEPIQRLSSEQGYRPTGIFYTHDDGGANNSKSSTGEEVEYWYKQLTGE